MPILVRARRSRHVPTVLTRDEVRRVLASLDGVFWLASALMYGSGLRLIEALRLRVKDVSFGYRQLIIHDGKGRKGRVVPLPDACTGPLRKQLDTVKVILDLDRERNFPGVSMPMALDRKYSSASASWPWQFRFPDAEEARGLLCRDLRHQIWWVTERTDFFAEISPVAIRRPLAAWATSRAGRSICPGTRQDQLA